MGPDLYCATSLAQDRNMVMLRSGDATVAFAATTSTTKGGEDIINPESELDSLSDTNDESQGGESDTNSEGQYSEEQHSDEEVASTSANDSEMEYDERHSTDHDEEIRNRKLSEIFNGNASFVRISRLLHPPSAAKFFASGKKTRNYVGRFVTPG